MVISVEYRSVGRKLICRLYRSTYANRRCDGVRRRLSFLKIGPKTAHTLDSQSVARLDRLLPHSVSVQIAAKCCPISRTQTHRHRHQLHLDCAISFKFILHTILYFLVHFHFLSIPCGSQNVASAVTNGFLTPIKN